MAPEGFLCQGAEKRMQLATLSGFQMALMFTLAVPVTSHCFSLDPFGHLTILSFSRSFLRPRCRHTSTAPTEVIVTKI